MKAFPVHEDVLQDENFEGMDLRDYFAAKVMQGILSSPYINTVKTSSIVKDAYELADAMMEERKK